jgi:hypothetical protein
MHAGSRLLAASFAVAQHGQTPGSRSPLIAGSFLSGLRPRRSTSAGTFWWLALVSS